MATTLAHSPPPFPFLSPHFTPSPPPFPPPSSPHPRRLSTTRLRASLQSPSLSCPPAAAHSLTVDTSSLVLTEATSHDELHAATCLRVRTFYEFKDQSFSIEDHKRYLVEREFNGLKERVAGNREGFRRVSCINASLPLSELSSLYENLCTTCKFPYDGEDRVVVGTLDLNKCIRLPDEMTGMRPQGIGADFARAYLSNVCVANELHKNGLGYVLVSKAKLVAEEWGITDLYVHVAVDNEPAKKLYVKSGFIYESDEPAWQARFLNRPKRSLLWFGLRNPYNL